MLFLVKEPYTDQPMRLIQFEVIMQNYESKVCVACHPDASKATKEQINEFLNNYLEWELIEDNQAQQLKRNYKFNDYTGAVDFTKKIADISEKEKHHPSILLEWGKVTVRWWTHKIKGLHENDFIMATKTDEIYNSNQ